MNTGKTSRAIRVRARRNFRLARDTLGLRRPPSQPRIPMKQRAVTRLGKMVGGSLRFYQEVRHPASSPHFLKPGQQSITSDELVRPLRQLPPEKIRQILPRHHSLRDKLVRIEGELTEQNTFYEGFLAAYQKNLVTLVRYHVTETDKGPFVEAEFLVPPPNPNVSKTWVAANQARVPLYDRVTDQLDIDGQRISFALKKLFETSGETKFSRGFRNFYDSLITDLKTQGFSEKTIDCLIGVFANELDAKNAREDKNKVNSIQEKTHALAQWLLELYEAPAKRFEVTPERIAKIQALQTEKGNAVPSAQEITARLEAHKASNQEAIERKRESIRQEILNEIYTSHFPSLVPFSERHEAGMYGAGKTRLVAQHELKNILRHLKAMENPNTALFMHVREALYESLKEQAEGRIERDARYRDHFIATQATFERKMARMLEELDQTLAQEKKEKERELAQIEAQIQTLQGESHNQHRENLTLRAQELHENLAQWDQVRKDRQTSLFGQEQMYNLVSRRVFPEMRQQAWARKIWQEDVNEVMAEFANWKDLLPRELKQRAYGLQKELDGLKGNTETPGRQDQIEAELDQIRADYYHLRPFPGRPKYESKEEEKVRIVAEKVWVRQAGVDLRHGIHEVCQSLREAREREAQVIFVQETDLGAKAARQVSEMLATHPKRYEALTKVSDQLRALEERLSNAEFQRHLPDAMKGEELVQIYVEELYGVVLDQLEQAKGLSQNARFMGTFKISGRNRQARLLLAALAFHSPQELVEALQVRIVNRLHKKAKSLDVLIATGEKLLPEEYRQETSEPVSPKDEPLSCSQWMIQELKKSAAGLAYLQRIEGGLKGEMAPEPAVRDPLRDDLIHAILIRDIQTYQEKRRKPKVQPKAQNNDLSVLDDYVDQRQRHNTFADFVSSLEKEFNKDAKQFRENCGLRGEMAQKLYKRNGEELTDLFVEMVSKSRLAAIRAMYPELGKPVRGDQPLWLEAKRRVGLFLKLEIASMDPKDLPPLLEGKKLEDLKPKDLVQCFLKVINRNIRKHQHALVRNGVENEEAFKQAVRGMAQTIKNEIQNYQEILNERRGEQEELFMSKTIVDQMVQDYADYRHYEIRHMVGEYVDGDGVVYQKLYRIIYPITRHFDFQVSSGSDLKAIEEDMQRLGLRKVWDSHNHPFSQSPWASWTDLMGYIHKVVAHPIFSMLQKMAGRRNYVSIGRANLDKLDAPNNGAIKEVPVYHLVEDTTKPVQNNRFTLKVHLDPSKTSPDADQYNYHFTIYDGLLERAQDQGLRRAIKAQELLGKSKEVAAKVLSLLAS